jgi:NADH:ubiquinone oxidoreductase subunit 5 (subunit L)/multisubunit Na+/H+ antiporter MnhA subunit
MVISSAVVGGQMALGAVFMGGAVLTILYLFRLFSKVFLGEPRGGGAPAVERSRLMVSCVAVLAALSLAGGFLAGWPAQLARAAVLQMPGVSQ